MRLKRSLRRGDPVEWVGGRRVLGTVEDAPPEYFGTRIDVRLQSGELLPYEHVEDWRYYKNGLELLLDCL